jgi:hypothetical protein
VRTFHGSFGLTGGTDNTLAHEATHQFQGHFFKDLMLLPSWVVEGMATYFGDGAKVQRKKVELNQIPFERLQSLQDAITMGRYVTIQNLLRIRKTGDPMVEMPCYDHGWGLIYWLLQGSKGKGEKVWKRYIDHLKEGPKLDVNEEAAVFTSLLLAETGYTSVEKWEEDYKAFIKNLALPVLGTWDASGKKWDGSKLLGVKLAFPDRMKPVKEGDLRRRYREAAAATTADGVRLFLSVFERGDDSEDQEKLRKEMLRNLVRVIFTGTTFDKEFEEEEVKEIRILDAIDMAVTKLRGRYTIHRETGIADEGGEKASAKGEKKAAKKSAAPAPSGGAADAGEQTARAVLFLTRDRIFLLCLTGPDAPFSKMESRFDDVLASIRLNEVIVK